MSADEFLALGQTREHYELVDGVILMSPSPTPRHQRVAMLISMQLLEQEARFAGMQTIADVDVQLSSRKVYRPDIIVFAPGRFTALPDRFMQPPELVIEVLSPDSKPLDLVTKRDDYESFGVQEYWVVDPELVTARIWNRRDDRLIESASSSGVIESTAINGLTVDLGKVRWRVGKFA
jgi:Uma2 family endonuclease